MEFKKPEENEVVVPTTEPVLEKPLVTPETEVVAPSVTVKSAPVENLGKPTRDEKVKALTEKMYAETRSKDEIWVTMVDPNRNYWNSGDYLHFHVTKGGCKKLPEELSEILENALSPKNRMLREATDREVEEELFQMAEGHLISIGEIKAKRFTQEDQPLKL